MLTFFMNTVIRSLQLLSDKLHSINCFDHSVIDHQSHYFSVSTTYTYLLNLNFYNYP
jgi:hypothetical protein